MKRLRFVFPVVLVAVLVLTTLASAQGELDPGMGSVNFTVQNLDSSETASVIASYINSSGEVAATVNEDILPRSSVGFPVSKSGLPDNWDGSVIVSSDREIVAFAQARWENGTFGDGKTAGAYNGFTVGANMLYFPSLAARPGKQITRLAIQSAEGASTTESIDITISFFDRDGAANYVINDTLLKGTQKTYDLLDDATIVPNRPDGWLGAATVESSDPIAGVATMHWMEYSGAYSGVTGGGPTAYVPSVNRRLPDGATWLQYTALIVQNLDSGAAANVTVYWYDRDGAELFSFDDIIPANSSHGYNTRQTGSDVPDHDALHTALGDNWNGSVVVSSDTNVVAVANLQWTDDSPVGLAATSFTSESSGNDEIFVPANFRRINASSEWLQFTGLIVQNVGDAACADFDVSWFNREGTQLLTFQSSLDPNIATGFNTAYGAGFPNGTTDTALLTDDFRGSVYIGATGCELIAVHNTLWPLWSDSTTYNAFGR